VYLLRVATRALQFTKPSANMPTVPSPPPAETKTEKPSPWAEPDPLEAINGMVVSDHEFTQVAQLAAEPLSDAALATPTPQAVEVQLE
jgi:hypothetical protein